VRRYDPITIPGEATRALARDLVLSAAAVVAVLVLWRVLS